jgi:hypothetical protein
MIKLILPFTVDLNTCTLFFFNRSVHEKIWKNFQTKKLIIAKMIVQCKQRYTRTSLPCSVALVDLR